MEKEIKPFGLTEKILGRIFDKDIKMGCTIKWY